jgi:hypothetical protein
MIVTEYRIPLPCTAEEYQVGQLYAVAQASLAETGNGEGIEVLVNDSIVHPIYGKCQYTKKKFYLTSKVPRAVAMIAPTGALILIEEAWNAYPRCVTVLKNEWMKDSFSLTTESMHVDGWAPSAVPNACNLTQGKLAVRTVDVIDIAVEQVEPKDYKEQEDPTRVNACGRGPLKSNWKDTAKPIMTCYKAVSAEFVWFGLQGKMEALLQSMVRAIMVKVISRLLLAYLKV